MKRATLLHAGLVLLVACAGDSGLDAPPVNFPQGIEAGPQVNQVTPTSAEVSVHTIADATATLDTASENGATASAGPTHGRAHRFELVGLEPDTEYSYSLEIDGVALPERYGFKTPAADRRTRYTFSVVGDPGSGTVEQLDMVAALEADPPDFLMTTGDNAYLEGTRWEVIHRYLVPFADLLSSIPFYATLGNHDVATRGGAPFLELANLPGNERYYSFRWGNGIFIALDTTMDIQPGSAQYDWLVNELATRPATWRVLYFHHPPYSSSQNGSKLFVRTSLCPVLDAHDVDLVFSGHDHNYERTIPIRSGRPAEDAGPDYVDPRGPIYVVTGGGGRRLYRSGSNWFTATSISIYHSVRVAIEGRTLVLEARDNANQPFDVMTITKTE